MWGRMSDEPILIDQRGAIRAITLNRPEALNAWTGELGADLLAAIRDASADPEVRVILIAGAGRSFSSGADLKAKRAVSADGYPDLGARLRTSYNDIILETCAAPKPVVAAVQGAAAGIGCSLALAADFIVASRSAYFLLAFTRVGLVADGGASYLLPQRIGLSRATRLLMLAEKLPAEQAHDWGLVHELCEDAALDQTAAALARRLANAATIALANTKRALAASMLPGLAEHLALEADLQTAQGRTDDFNEGVTAFRERRSTNFQGR